jgi:hypothetical protein
VGHYFDRQGHPIDAYRWVKLFNDLRYRFVAEKNVNGYRVMTIWTGFDPYLSDTEKREPLIFETTISLVARGTVKVIHQKQRPTLAKAKVTQGEYERWAEILTAVRPGSKP